MSTNQENIDLNEYTDLSEDTDVSLDTDLSQLMDLSHFDFADQVRAFAQFDQIRLDEEYARRFAEEVVHLEAPAAEPVAPVVPLPPPQPTTSGPIRRLSILTECTICQERPVDPRGCRSCLNIIGCKDCCLNWAKQASQPSCPLCRDRWTRSAPRILMVQTIRKRLNARAIQRSLPSQ